MQNSALSIIIVDELIKVDACRKDNRPADMDVPRGTCVPTMPASINLQIVMYISINVSYNTIVQFPMAVPLDSHNTDVEKKLQYSWLIE